MEREEIFRTKSAGIAQCDTSNNYVLTYENEEFFFRLCDLYTFKKKIMSCDLVKMLDTKSPDIEIIYLPWCDRFLTLTIQEVLEFRELLNGTFDTLALVSVVQQTLRLSIYN